MVSRNFEFTEGSRLVKIVPRYRKTSVLPNEVLEEVVNKFGSCFKDNSATEIIRGFDPEEEIKYMPDKIGVQPSASDWSKSLKEYWADYTVVVPIGEIDPTTKEAEGLTLQVGLEKVKDNSTGKIVEVLKPISLDDYIKFRFLLQHPQVAITDDELDNFDSGLYRAKLVDIEAARIEKNKNKVRRLEATKVVFKVLRDLETLEGYSKFELIKKEAIHQETLDQIIDEKGIIKEKVLSDDIEAYLSDVAEQEPELLLRIDKLQNVYERVIIRLALEYKVFDRQGNNIYYGNDQIESDPDMNKAIAYLLNNSESYLRIKGNLQQLGALRGFEIVENKQREKSKEKEKEQSKTVKA